MCSVQGVYMPLPGRSVCAGKLVLYCDAANVAPTQKDQPPISLKGRLHLKTCKSSWKKKKTYGLLCSAVVLY
jgi:hypothetical protein